MTGFVERMCLSDAKFCFSIFYDPFPLCSIVDMINCNKCVGFSA